MTEEPLSNCISGVSISQLSSVKLLLPDDELLVSEPCLDVRRPVNWRSKKVSFEQLSSKLMDDISAILKFGSMAWENKEDYAAWDHSHSCYNRVTGVSCFYENDVSGTIDLGTIAVDSRTYHLRMPKPYIQSVDQPVVGQIKFKATQESPREINWQSSGFDGWVYPDGSCFPLTAFNVGDRFEISGEYFKVPVLSDFIMLNSAPYVSVDLRQDYSDFVPAHIHTVDISLSGEITGHFKYRSSGAGAGTNSHGASRKDKLFPYKIDFDYSDIKIKDSDYILSNDEVGTESWPSHTLVRTMIYIGLPNTEVV